MKSILRAAVAIAVFMVGFAAGYPAGKTSGFLSGAEWSSIQASILAREAGVFMPVYYESGVFRVVFKQKKNFYKQAKQMADENNGGAMLASDQVSVAAGQVQLVSMRQHADPM